MDYPLINKDYSADAVILCDGDFPTHPIPVAIMQGAKYLCCCDGAGKKYIAHGGMPNAIVGDGDSLPEEFKKQYSDILHICDEQEDNDQTKATLHCMENGATSIAYIGATGKREDHTLGNISLLLRYMKVFSLRPVMITDHGYFVPASGNKTFASFPNQQVSTFNCNCKDISSTGLKWNSYAYDCWWQGTLNEAVSDSFTIKADGEYIVFRTFEAKQITK